MIACRTCNLDNPDDALTCARCSSPLVSPAGPETKQLDSPETVQYITPGTHRFTGATRLQFRIKGENEEINVALDQQVIIGRGPGVDVDLAKYNAVALGVSRIHAVIARNDGGLTLTDLSSNGTWCNGKRLTKNAPTHIQEGVHLWFSSLECILFFAV